MHECKLSSSFRNVNMKLWKQVVSSKEGNTVSFHPRIILLYLALVFTPNLVSSQNSYSEHCVLFQKFCFILCLRGQKYLRPTILLSVLG